MLYDIRTYLLIYLKYRGVDFLSFQPYKNTKTAYVGLTPDMLTLVMPLLTGQLEWKLTF